jgi:predicted nucleic acid-binding protein
MGVILDSSILIAGERAKESVAEVLERVEAVCGKTAAALSAVTAVELTHGIYRARTDTDRKRRETFVEELFQAVAVHPLTLEVARPRPDASMASRWAGASASTSRTCSSALQPCIWASMSSRST